MKRWLLLLGMVCVHGLGEDLSQPQRGVSLALAEARAANLADVRYDYRLVIPESKGQPIEGELILSLERKTNDGPLVLDFTLPQEKVKAVSVYSADRWVDVRFSTVANHLLIPAEGLQVGQNRVRVSFTAGDGSLNRNEDFLYTLFVPDRAHHAVPCFDQPNIKGRFKLRLTVPSSWKAVANTRATDIRAGVGTYTYQFAESQPISTYLFAFAAGVFEVERATRDGLEMNMYHRETNEETLQRNREALFDLHIASLRWLEEYTGIKYPFGKFDFVVVPGFQYSGMEHPGAVLYRASALMLDADPPDDELLGRASLIAHETAHMWFGDLVTMSWFNDVWMKEVFANFMAAKIVEPNFPQIDHQLRFFLAHHLAAYGVDRTAGANAVRQHLDNLIDAGNLYGAIIYRKAPVLMKQLEGLLGEATFQEGIRRYLAENTFGNAPWPVLIQILDALHEEDLQQWSKVWISRAGRPEVRVALTASGEEISALRLVQAQQADGAVWNQKLNVLLFGEEETVSLDAHLKGDHLDLAMAKGRSLPRAILVGGSESAYGVFPLDAESRSWFMEKLPELEKPLWRALVWMAMYEDVLEGRMEASGLLALGRKVLVHEENALVQSNVLGDMETLFWRFLDQEQRLAMAPELEALLWRLTGQHEGGQKTRFFRAYRSMVVTEAGTERLARIWRNEEELAGLTLSENDRVALVAALAVRRYPNSDALISQQLERIENLDRKRRFAFVRDALSQDHATRKAFFQRLAREENRAVEPWVVEGLGYLNHPLHGEESTLWLRQSLELVEEIQRTGDIFFPKQWLDASLSGVNTPEAAGIVEKFLAEHPDYPYQLKLKMLQAADLLMRAARARD